MTRPAKKRNAPSASALGVLVGTALVVAMGLSGCAETKAEAPAVPEPTTQAEALVPTVEAVDGPAKPFSRPLSCDTLVPQVRLDAFVAEGLILLGGPGGKYGVTYLADRTPEEQFGGITCIWGTDGDDASVYTVSAALVSSATAPTIISQLELQGLNTDDDTNAAGESTPGATRYWLLGDDEGAPALLNVLRDDSWISVIVTEGGQRSFETAAVIAREVADIGYNR